MNHHCHHHCHGRGGGLVPLLFALCVIVPVVTATRPGGWHSLDPSSADSVQYGRFCAAKLSAKTMISYKLIRIVSIRRQVVAGLRFKIILEVARGDRHLERHRFEVWDHFGKLKLTSHAQIMKDGASDWGIVPPSDGASRNSKSNNVANSSSGGGGASNVDDSSTVPIDVRSAWVQELARFAVDAFNRRAGSIHPQSSLLAVVSARRRNEGRTSVSLVAVLGLHGVHSTHEFTVTLQGGDMELIEHHTVLSALPAQEVPLSNTP